MMGGGGQTIKAIQPIDRRSIFVLLLTEKNLWKNNDPIRRKAV